MTTVESVRVLDETRQHWNAFGPLRSAYVGHEAVRSAIREAPRAVWIAARAAEVAHHLLDAASARSRGRLILLEEPAPSLRAALLASFETVVAPPAALIPPDELAEVLASSDRKDRCVGGIVDRLSGVVVLYRGDLDTIAVPLHAFEPSGDGTEPDFSRFGVTDFGQTLAFGDYEASFEAVLFEQDPEYRRRENIRRLAKDRSFGAQLRRLRKQRKLRRTDFPGVSARTIARIERGEIGRPRGRTLAALREQLPGWLPDDGN